MSSTTVDRSEKGQSLLSCIDNYVVIDLETTGLDPQIDSIIELASIRVENNEVVDSFSSLINPGFEIDDFITELTGITNDMLTDAPRLEDVLPPFMDFVGSSIVVGHNVNFDINFLYDACDDHFHHGFPNDYIDTMRLSRRLYPDYRHHRLCDLLDRFSIIPDGQHRALADVLSTHQCYQYMKHYIAENNIHFDISYSFLSSQKISAKTISTTRTDFNTESPLYGKSFVFTGVLARMTRKDAMQAVVDHGGKCFDGVSKKVNFLVLGNNDYCSTIRDGKSHKQKCAEKLKLEGNDIEIISENVFYDMLEV